MTARVGGAYRWWARALLGAGAALSLAGGSAMGQAATTVAGPEARGAAPSNEGFVTTSDGVRLYYRRIGSGPVVIVPGHVFVQDAFSRLARGRALILYDMRNRGRSDSVADTSTLTVQRDVQDLEEIRRHFAADRVQLVGYSYLGLMVMLYALEHPQRVERVVQLGPVPLRFGTEYPAGTGVAPPPDLSDSTSLVAARAMRESGRHLEDPRQFCELSWDASRFGLIGDPAHVSRLGESPCHLPNEWPTTLARHFRHHFPSVQRLEVSPSALAAFDRPVLVVHGTRDRNAPYGAGQEWARLLPNARLLTVPNGAHRAWADAPELVLGVIEGFLAGGWPEVAERVL